MARKATTYWDYIKVEEITSLQGGLEANDAGLDNDEVMFITIHQIDELWLKLALRELVSVRDLFKQERVPEQSLSSAVRGLRRMALLFGLVADHFPLMETMTTRDYLAFRDKLSPASGFQSAQLREIELLMGLGDEQRIPLGHEGTYMRALRAPDGSESAASRRVARRKEDLPTLQGRDHRVALPHADPGLDARPPGRRRGREALRRRVLRRAGARGHAPDRPGGATPRSTRADGRASTSATSSEIDGARAFLLAHDVADDQRRGGRASAPRWCSSRATASCRCWPGRGR
jgi:tryptophan 2,3-dioxygenase